MPHNNVLESNIRIGKTCWWALACLGLTAVTAAGQPYIRYRGVLNAASQTPQGLPGGGIARGSIFSIYGKNLGPAESQTASSFPLNNELGGVSVQVIQGAMTLAAVPTFVSSNQVSAIMPSSAPLGKAAIKVQFNSRTSNPAVINVVESAFGIFTANSLGFGPGAIQNVVSDDEQPFNTTRQTAQPGQTMMLWGTGLGAVSYADNIAPAQEDLPVKVEVLVAGKPAASRYSGRAPCCAGRDQIIFELPADVPSGCYVPVQVRTDSSVVSNAATISIEQMASPARTRSIR